MLWNWKNIIKNWIYFSLNQFEANSLSEYQILSFRTKFKQTNGKLKIHLANSFTIKKFLQKCILLLFIIQLRDHQNGHQQMIEWEQKELPFWIENISPQKNVKKNVTNFMLLDQSLFLFPIKSSYPLSPFIENDFEWFTFCPQSLLKSAVFLWLTAVLCWATVFFFC